MLCLGMTPKIIDDEMRYLLTDEAFWETDIASGSKRIYCSNDKSLARCFFPCLVAHGAKTIQFVSVQNPCASDGVNQSRAAVTKRYFGRMTQHNTTIDVKAQLQDHSKPVAALCQ